MWPGSRPSTRQGLTDGSRRWRFPCSGWLPKLSAPGDDGQAQGALGLVVGWRQGMVGDEGDDGAPVVEDFTGEGADFLGLMIAVELAGPFQAGLDRVEDGMVLVLGDGLDQAAQFADHPVSEADAVGMEATSQGDPLADQVRGTFDGGRSRGRRRLPIGDQPAEDGVADGYGAYRDYARRAKVPGAPDPQGPSCGLRPRRHPLRSS